MRKSPDTLYVLSCGNPKQYKIGITSNIEQRIKSIQTGNPEKVVLEYAEVRDNPIKIERYLHRLLYKYRKEGEWFSGEGLDLRRIRGEIFMYHD